MSTHRTSEQAVRPLAPTAQLGPAMALVELLKHDPPLPPANWDITRFSDALVGSLGRAEFGALRAYADVLGGEIAPDGEFVGEDGTRLRTHRLRAVWQDVRIAVSVYRPAPVAKAVAA